MPILWYLQSNTNEISEQSRKVKLAKVKRWTQNSSIWDRNRCCITSNYPKVAVAKSMELKDKPVSLETFLSKIVIESLLKVFKDRPR